jgi:hypothetical protein
LLPAEIAQAVKRIQFVTGRQVADVMAGAYLSVFKGRGMEFEEVRPYVPGDDVRTIDWNVTARTGEPHVKRFVEERELTVMLLVDVSASQDFGSGRRSKLEAAVRRGWRLLRHRQPGQGRAAAVHGQAEAAHPPRGQARPAGGARCWRAGAMTTSRSRAPGAGQDARAVAVGLARAWQRLRQATAGAGAEPRRATSIGMALEFCQKVLHRRTCCFWSPTLRRGLPGYCAPPAAATTGLRAGRQARAASGRRPDHPEDAESGRTGVYDTRSPAFRAAVATAGERRIAALTSTLRASRIDLIRIDATRPVVEPLLQFFRMRERRQRR